MLRSLIILLVILFGVWLVRREIRRVRARPDGTTSPSVAAMKPCAYCGVHVPVSQGVSADGRFFCSEEHRRTALPS
jgi:uncharacterized protein